MNKVINSARGMYIGVVSDTGSNSGNATAISYDGRVLGHYCKMNDQTNLANSRPYGRGNLCESLIFTHAQNNGKL